MGQKEINIFFFMCLLSLMTLQSYSQETNEISISWNKPNTSVCFQYENDLCSWIEKQLPFSTTEQYDYISCGKTVKIAIVYGYSGLVRFRVYVFLFRENNWILDVESDTYYYPHEIIIKQIEGEVLIFSENKPIGTYLFCEDY